MAEPFSLAARLRSVSHALRGLRGLAAEHNCRVHAVATVLVVMAGVVVGVHRLEWMLLIAAIGLVWMAEAFNTALERLADAVSPAPHPLIGEAKDIAAAAVLLAAVTALCLGGWVFVPYLCASWSGE
ncbi:MAG TPA: diacylglycerol kinase family protein [Pseudomonadales bacterium]|jgi:diacylglycerol kinase